MNNSATGSKTAHEAKIGDDSCFILLNARAGAFHASASARQIQQLADEINLKVEIIATVSAEEMQAKIRALVQAGAATIAVAGGDGTVALAVQELAQTETALGILPQGTFNNFATALRLPTDLTTAMAVLKNGEVRSVDLGFVEVKSGKGRQSRYFTEATGVGLFADSLAIYGKGTNKNFFKGLKAMSRVLLNFRAHRLTLDIDGDRHIERAVMCTVANTYRMGQGISVAPGAKVTDGELDIVIVGNLSLAEIFRYYGAFRAQAHLTLPKVTHFRARKIEISSSHSLNVHCDDSFVGSTPATISAKEGALKVLLEKI